MAKKKGTDYFALLLEMAKCSQQAATLLVEILDAFDADSLAQQMDRMHAIEHAGDEHKHEMVNRLANEFITPIDREDFMDIAGEIDDVTDNVEDVLLKAYMYGVKQVRPGAMDFARLIEKSCTELASLMKEFAGFRKSQKIHASIVELNRLEEEGDALYTQSVRDLFLSQPGSAELIAWNELFACFEKCCDSCEHVANLVENVIMKNT